MEFELSAVKCRSLVNVYKNDYTGRKSVQIKPSVMLLVNDLKMCLPVVKRGVHFFISGWSDESSDLLEQDGNYLCNTKAVADFSEKVSALAQLKDIEQNRSFDDGYGDCRPVSTGVIDNARKLVECLPCSILKYCQFFPMATGAILYRYDDGSNVLRGELSENKTSFYCKKKGGQPFFSSCMDWNAQSLSFLKNKLLNVVSK